MKNWTYADFLMPTSVASDLGSYSLSFLRSAVDHRLSNGTDNWDSN